MEISAGICIIYRKKILLVHPTKCDYIGHYSFPKGHIEANESLKETASREVREEIGIEIDPNRLNDYIKVPLFHKGEIWKEVYIFPLVIKSLSEIGIEAETLPISKLDTKEVNHASFFSYEDAEVLLHKRYHPFLKFIE